MASSSSSRPPWQERGGGSSGDRGASGRATPAGDLTVATAFAGKHSASLRELHSTSHTLHVLSGTWNVNGKALHESLDVWLNEVVPAPDLVVVGFQELDLSAETFLLNNSSKASPWEAAILAALDKRAVPGGYTHVVSKQLVGILIVVCAKSRIVPHLKVLAVDSAGVGILGVMGNKGGAGVLLRVFDEEWLFINSHLAAGQSKEARRNQDFAELSRRLSFLDRTPASGAFDAIVWLGDLNYRIDLPNETVRAAVAVGDYAVLRKSDQLLKARAAGKAFAGYSEGKLQFIPTYKYDNGTNIFDSSSKNRVPAWTDRVLYRFAHPGAWSLVSYTTTTALLTSDHKPVTAHFIARAASIDSHAAAAAAQDARTVALNLVSALKTSSTPPQLAVEPSLVDFGELAWGHPLELQLILSNPSDTLPAMYSLHRDPATGLPLPSWVQLADGPSALAGVLAPGASTSLALTVLIGPDAVARRTLRPDSSGVAHLEALLQFSLQGNPTSPAIVVPLRGTYKPWPFGASLNALTRSSSSDVPLHLWYLLEALRSPSILATPGLFTRAAADLDRDVASVRGLAELLALLSSSPAAIPLRAARGELAPHTLAAALLHLLASWSVPVIPPDRAPEVFGVTMSPSPLLAARTIIDSLSLAHYNVFWYLVAFMGEVLRCADDSSAPAVEDLLSVFARVMLREPDAINVWPERTAAKVAFLALFVRRPCCATAARHAGQP
ncbi:RhoGAP domain-containing protein [Thecamonas trahens ATCC 50062]|uniref:RhoGAP domain-containing protein n=1 Tax=Thecamonas trahens ATCC 50062 TaxID=461836 RepID=A0A0L0DIZ7_THETB|nr:RhoGAP domain-containing protein [Thecamonas trahens ATCC 50062]KNC52282.1 RhoGAP domain-containing protein [Thecamonas trahens ATCC 50062]|eukprot:XP_013762281.1 RhoGAP domain-containing protein [Thecamonas trahens ATCC 50062]